MAYWVEQVFNGLGLVGPTLLVAVSITITLQAVRALNVAIAASVVVAALVGIKCSHAAGSLGLILGCLASGVGLVVATELGVLRPQRSRHLRDAPMASFAATLGLSIALTALAAIVTNSNEFAISPSMLQFNSVFSIGDIQVVGLSLGIFGVAVIVTFGWLLFQRWTGLGTLFQASAANHDLAVASGVRVNRVALLSAVLSGLLIGLTAFLALVQSREISANSGAAYLITPFVACVLGGLGNLGGAAVAAIALGIAQSLMAGKIGNPNVQSAVIFGTLFVALLVRPTGFAGATLGERDY